MNSKQACTQRSWLSLVICGALSLASLGAVAQVPPAAPQPQEMVPPPGDPVTPIDIADSKLDQFADALVVVQDIQRTAMQRVEQEPDAQKAEQVKAQAEREAIVAVEKTGLPIVEFNQIAQAIQTDLALREKVAARLAQRRSSDQPPAS